VTTAINDSAAQAPGRRTREEKRVLAGTLVGTTIEWYDFFIYAQAAAFIFAPLFFDPVGSDNLAQIFSWASIGISFLFRPLGAIIAGHLGDRYGRKTVLVVTLVGMGLATALIGVLPTYETIGVAAPVLLILLRILRASPPAVSGAAPPSCPSSTPRARSADCSAPTRRSVSRWA
jgi:MFS family permease